VFHGYVTELREIALRAALELRNAEYGDGNPDADLRRVLHAADKIASWLSRPNPPARLDFAVSAVRAVHPERHVPMANLQVPVGYEFDINVTADDIEGNPVPDTLSWTISDTTNTTLTVDDATTLKVTVQVLNPSQGVVITATDPTGVTGTLDFDAVPDVVASLTLAPATPVKIPTA